MSLGAVTKHLFDLIAKQVEDHKLVVWYDPDKVYIDVAAELELPATTEASSSCGMRSTICLTTSSRPG